MSASGLPARLSRREPKGAQLREILGGLVGELEPGAALPSERELAERYDVARMTVRTELDRLCAEGQAYRVHGRGTFVAEPRVAQANALTSFSEDMRARGRTPSSRVLAHEVIEAGPSLAGRLRVRPSAAVVHVHRLRLADDEPLVVEELWLSLERHPDAAEADFEDASLFELLAGWGVDLADADQRVLAVPIGAEDAELLGADAGAAGLRFESLAREADGEPAYFAVSLFRGDHYEVDLRQVRL